MSSGDEGVLTLTIKMRVSPEPGSGQELINLMRRYREALNYAIEVVIENKALSLGKAHKLLYSVLKERYGLPSKVAQDCYREAITVAKSWLRNPKKGKIPKVKTLKLWLTQGQSYRVKDCCIELIGGLKLEITGWDRRYDSYPNREARLVYRNGEFFLMITKQIPKPSKYTPKGVVAVDVNEKEIVFGNSVVRERRETAIERALHYKKLAEKLQQKYSFSKYNAWLRRRGILKRIRHFHRKARNIVDDWAKKVSREIAELAKRHRYAVAREDLTGLIEKLRELPRNHKVALLILSYRKLAFWIDWQCEKLGVPIIPVEPEQTSSTCPNCSSRLKGNGYRQLKCPRCGLVEDRDRIAVLNIEKRALELLNLSGGPLTAPTAPQMTDVFPNRCGEPNRPEGTLRPLGRGGGQTDDKFEAIYAEAKRKSRENGNYELFATACLEIGSYYIENDYKKAEKFLYEVYELRGILDEKRAKKLLNSIANLGLLYCKLRRFDMAKVAYEKARNMVEELGVEDSTFKELEKMLRSF